MTLDQLKIQDKAIVRKVTSSGVYRRRLLDMGFVDGSEVYINNKAPLGDPIEVIIKDVKLAIRKKDAKNIIVEKR